MFRSSLIGLFALVIAGGCAARTATRTTATPDGGRWQVEMQDGVPHGRTATWHPNGTVASTGYYHEGRRHGEFVYYDRDGVEIRREWYERGDLVEKPGAAGEPSAAGAPAGPMPDPGGAAGEPSAAGTPAGPMPDPGVVAGAREPHGTERADGKPMHDRLGIGGSTSSLGRGGLHVISWGPGFAVAGSLLFASDSPEAAPSVTLVEGEVALLFLALEAGRARLAAGPKVAIGHARLGGGLDRSATRFGFGVPVRAEAWIHENFALHAETALLIVITNEDLGDAFAEGSRILLNDRAAVLGTLGFTIYF